MPITPADVSHLFPPSARTLLHSTRPAILVGMKVEWGQMPKGSTERCSVEGCDEIATQYRAEHDREGEYVRSCYCVRHAWKEGLHRPGENPRTLPT